MQRMFKIFENNRSRSLDAEELSYLIKDYRMGLTDEEIKTVFSFFDRNGTGMIDYDEFLRGIIGEMNDYRKSIVKKVFSKLDKNQNGVVEISDIRGLYNATRHPDVISGKKTEDDVLAEWLDNFDQYSYLKV
jgi:Ca2+-binding EF-hand superfamily protein